MEEAEYIKIIELYESHLQVKKLNSPGTVRLYLHSVNIFIRYCEKFKQNLVLPEQWEIADVGLRELEAFLKYQIDIKRWKRSTLVTCISGVKSFLDYLTETHYILSNPIQHFKLPRDISEIGKQRFDVKQINKLFHAPKKTTLEGCQQRLLLELIYGLGMSLSKIANIKTAILNNKIIRFAFCLISFPFNVILICSPLTIIKLDIALIRVSIVLNVKERAKTNTPTTIRVLLSLSIKSKKPKSGTRFGFKEKAIKPEYPIQKTIKNIITDE